jgi:2-phospho-L-lactate guanylyltransferase
MRAPDWTIILPVKRLSAGKSRLRASGLAHPGRLAFGMALDTVESVRAAAGVAEVLVVTDDRRVARAAESLGAVPLADPGGGLNAAIAHAASKANPGRPVAALLADLPALRHTELSAALRAAGRLGLRAFAADHTGTGTTLLAGFPGVPLDPRFGADSAEAHAASGALALGGRWPGLRLDVDTRADLLAAVALGVGPRTAGALAW